MVFTNVLTPRLGFPRNTADDYSKIVVKWWASIGASATIVTGVTLHEYAYVATGAMVTSDIPAYAIVSEVPTKVIGWMSVCRDRLDFSLSDTVTDSEGHVYQRVGAYEVPRLA